MNSARLVMGGQGLERFDVLVPQTNSQLEHSIANCFLSDADIAETQCSVFSTYQARSRYGPPHQPIRQGITLESVRFYLFWFRCCTSVLCITHHHNHYLEHAQLDGQVIEHYQFSQTQKINATQLLNQLTRHFQWGYVHPNPKVNLKPTLCTLVKDFESSEVGLQAVLGRMLVLGMLPYSFIHYKHVKSEKMTSITTSLKKSANPPQ